ncbi:type II secretion system F family protein [Candidatus Woesearchaeota archaeon]|nr:type II secretion system F family protein [Candidatus Woesearchaeota archaeon]
MTATVFRIIASKLPGIGLKLRQAGFMDEPAVFVQKTAMSAFYLTTGLMLVTGVLLTQLNVLEKAVFFLAPLMFILTFAYFLKAPDVIIMRKEKEINREIVFAGRFLVIEMKSGVPVYNAMRAVALNYETTGKYFQEIIDKVDLGIPMEEALNEQIEFTPSANFRKLLWQILNSMRTGSDISLSINATVDQIAKEQVIEIREYGRKLNPLAMFYLIIAVIMPSIGLIMLVITASFLSLSLDIGALLAIAGLVGAIQLMFLMIIKSSRPSVEV